MEEKIIQENWVTLVGSVASEVVLGYEFCNKKFMKMTIAVERLSGTKDYIPVEFEDIIINNWCPLTGTKVKIYGAVRTYNKSQEDGKRHLKMYVEAEKIEPAHEEDMNEVILKGKICKPPKLRITPSGKNITEMIVANNVGRKSSYIPCIAWGSVAYVTSYYEIGSSIKMKGRFQSRNYIKTLPSGEREERTTYEISINELIN